MLTNKRNLNILKGLPGRQAKAAFFAGGRATATQITQVEESALVHRYVGKVRGVVVCGPDDKFLFGTQAEALEAARWYLRDCQQEAAADPPPIDALTEQA